MEGKPVLTPLSCIAIDDEPMALRLIKNYVQKLPNLQIEGFFNSATAAINYAAQHKPHVVLTDIEMPGLSGLQIQENLPYRPLLIYTTAHTIHAATGFEQQAIDYLVKPFSFERFEQAIYRAMEYHLLKQQQAQNPEQEALTISVEYKRLRIPLADIMLLEAMQDYVKIYRVHDKPLLTLSTLKILENQLPPDRFIRIHRSYIVGLKHVAAFQRSKVQIAGQWLPVGQAYLQNLNGILGL
ncbi:MAG TPA: LytTR family DNA-binding domain-containing protein [Phnomibacter sp.]|nr:LytTR family DNA-binding domain-containing protein [Phnomibacter sp.]